MANYRWTLGMVAGAVLFVGLGAGRARDAEEARANSEQSSALLRHDSELIVAFGTVFDPGTTPPPLPGGLNEGTNGVPPKDPGYSSDPQCHFQSSGDIDPLSSSVSVTTTELGTLAGDFNVSPDGHARYTIPIEVPPGIGGLTPKLAFEYESGAGNGVMGVGWQIAGLSTISRCPKTIAVDGVRRAVVYDGQDAFCLDGKRLIRTGTSGSNYLFRTETETFTKVIGNAWDPIRGPVSFTAYTKDGRIMHFGSDPVANNSTIIVQVTEGQRVSSWHLDAVYDRSPAGTRFTVKYINSKAQDGTQDFRPDLIIYNSSTNSTSDGMSVRFRYETTPRQDLARIFRGGARFSNAYRLSSVDIGRCTHLVRSYKLTYEYAPNTSTGRSRLTSIQECANTLQMGTQVTFACKPATQFGWQNGNQGWKSPKDIAGFNVADPYWMNTRIGPPLPPYPYTAGQPISTVPPPIGWNGGTVYEPLIVDLDGNGTPEMIEFTGWDASNTFITIHKIDQDGSSTTRALPPVNTSAISRVDEEYPDAHDNRVCRDPSARPINHRSKHSGHGNAQDGGKFGTHAIPMDYDNDGRMDLVLKDPTSNWVVLKQTSNSNSFNTISFTAVDTGVPRECPNTQGYEPVLFIDMNGDGLKDILECRNTFDKWSWWYRQTTPNGFNRVAWDTILYPAIMANGFKPIKNPDGTFFGQHCNYADLLLMDYNGDGAEDLVTTDESYYSATAPYAMGPVPADNRLLRALTLQTPPVPAYATDTSAFPPSFSGGEKGLSIPRFQGENANWVTASYHTVDFTGDGLQDVLIVENYRPDYQTDPLKIALSIYQNNSDGNAWFDQQVGRTGFNPWISANADLYGNHVGAFDLVVDANHDGKPDLLSMNSFYNDNQTFEDGVLKVYYLINGLVDRSHFNSYYEILRLDPSGTRYRRSCEVEVGGSGCGSLTNFPNDGATYYRSGRILAGHDMGALPPFPTMRYTLPFIPMLTDIDLDGLEDLVVTKPAGPGEWAGMTYQFRLAKGSKPDLLTTIRDGLNCPGGLPCLNTHPASVTITYNTLKERETYKSNSTGCTFPQRCVPPTGVITVVDEVKYDAGNGNTRDYSYFYSDARTDALGRGWLGFRTVTESRKTGDQIYDKVVRTYDNGINLAGNSTYDSNRKAYPTAGTLLKEVRTVYTDVNVSHEIVDTTITTPTVKWLNDSLVEVASISASAKTFFVRPRVTTSTRTDNGTLVLSSEVTSTFNRFGDVESSVKTSAGQDSQTGEKITTFYIDTTNWLLGLPTNVIVRSTVPPAAPVVQEHASTYDTTTVTGRGVNGTGFLLTRTVEPNIPAQKLVTTYKRDYQVTPTPPSLIGNVVQETVVAPTGSTNTRVTSYVYDNKAQVVKVQTNSAGHSTTYTYDRDLGLKLGESFNNGTTNGITSRWAYDAFGRVALEVGADGSRTVTTRYQVSATDPNMVVATHQNDGKRVFNYLDRLGRVKAVATCGSGSTSNALGFTCQWVSTSTAYDDDGRIKHKTNPEFDFVQLQYTRYEYDFLGRETKRTYPDGGIVMTRYDGRFTTTKNARGHTSSIEKDVRGRIIRSTDVLNGVVSTAFGAFDLPVTVASPGATGAHSPYANVSFISYDNYGRRLSLRNMYGVTYSTMTYNAFGEVETATNARGEVARLTYDSLGRSTTRIDIEGTTTWTWDAFGVFGQRGKLAQVAISGTGADRGNTTRYKYTPVGQTSSIEQTAGGATLILGYSYNSATGQLDTTTYPENTSAAVISPNTPCSARKAFKTRNVYDIVGNLKRVEDGCNSANPLFFTMNSLDPNGNLASETRASITTTRTFDQNERPNVINTRAGTTNVFYLDLDYDLNGNVTWRSDTVAPRTESYTYDELDRLRSASVVSGTGYQTNATYDAAGNIVTKDGFYYNYMSSAYPQAVTDIRFPPGPPYNGAVVKAFTYDSNGNIKTPWSGGTITYSSFDKPRRFVNGTTTIDFKYDPDRNRVQKVGTTSGTTLYMNGLYERHSKVVGSNTNWTHRYYITAYGMVVAQVNRQQSLPAAPAVVESRQYLISDHLGTAGVITDSAGSPIERRQYNAFGELKAPATVGPASAPVNLGFTGQENDGAEFANLVNMKARMYDPKLGRFLNPDPLVQAPTFTQSHNRYSYVRNNPLRNSDPSGMECMSTADGGVSCPPGTGVDNGGNDISTGAPAESGSSGTGSSVLNVAASHGMASEAGVQNQGAAYMFIVGYVFVGFGAFDWADWAFSEVERYKGESTRLAQETVKVDPSGLGVKLAKGTAIAMNASDHYYSLKGMSGSQVRTEAVGSQPTAAAAPIKMTTVPADVAAARWTTAKAPTLPRNPDNLFPGQPRTTISSGPGQSLQTIDLSRNLRVLADSNGGNVRYQFQFTGDRNGLAGPAWAPNAGSPPMPVRMGISRWLPAGSLYPELPSTCTPGRPGPDWGYRQQLTGSVPHIQMDSDLW